MVKPVHPARSAMPRWGYIPRDCLRAEQMTFQIKTRPFRSVFSFNNFSLYIERILTGPGGQSSPLKFTLERYRL